MFKFKKQSPNPIRLWGSSVWYLWEQSDLSLHIFGCKAWPSVSFCAIGCRTEAFWSRSLQRVWDALLRCQPRGRISAFTLPQSVHQRCQICGESKFPLISCVIFLPTDSPQQNTSVSMQHCLLKNAEETFTVIWVVYLTFRVLSHGTAWLWTWIITG